MYIVQTALVLLAVYLAPALAAWPALIVNPRTALAIPFISVLIVFFLQSALASLGLYHPLSVQALSAAFVFTAAARLYRNRLSFKRDSGWTSHHRKALAIALALSAYIGLRLLESGFDESDEIYSWNMWAIQHYLGEGIDWSYTAAPYPQLFPKLLSYGYMLLGTIEAQTAVKTSLVVFPLCIFFTIGLAAGDKDNRNLIGQAVLGLLLIKGVELGTNFDEGMPDALMTAAFSASLFYFHAYQRIHKNRTYLFLFAATAVVAVLSKQPALLWALFSLPALLAYGAIKKTNGWGAFGVGLIPAASAILWMLTEGRDFQDNDGVIARSFEGRDYFSQLIASLERWILFEPGVLILIALTVFVAARNRMRLDVIVLFTLPSLIIWFLFAAYDVRAGAPALASMAIVIAMGNYGLRDAASPSFLSPKVMRAFVAGLFALTVISGVSELAYYKAKHPSFQLGFTPRNNLFKTFGEDADLIYSEIRNKDVKLWTSSNYVYGLFYGYIDVMRPAVHDDSYNAKMLLKQIETQRPDFLTDSGGIPFGNGGKALNSLATTLCPELFERFAGPDNKYGITIYRLRKSALDAGSCQL